MSSYLAGISRDTAQYLRRKFHEAAKGFRRRRRNSPYERLEGDDFHEFAMLEGIAAYLESLLGSGENPIIAEFSEYQFNYIRQKLPRLYKLLWGGG